MARVGAEDVEVAAGLCVGSLSFPVTTLLH